MKARRSAKRSAKKKTSFNYARPLLDLVPWKGEIAQAERGHIKPLIEALRSDHSIEPSMLAYLRKAIADLFEKKYIFKRQRRAPLKEDNTPPEIKDFRLEIEISGLHQDNKKLGIPNPLLAACKQYATNNHLKVNPQTILRYYRGAQGRNRERGWCVNPDRNRRAAPPPRTMAKPSDADLKTDGDSK